MNCLTKLFQQKRRRIGYIQAFSGPMISKRDSSVFYHIFQVLPWRVGLWFVRIIQPYYLLYLTLFLLACKSTKKNPFTSSFLLFFSAYLSYSGRHIKLLPFQGARRADMNTQGECPGLGASAPSGREGIAGGVRGLAGGVKGFAGMREGEWRLIC